jgi:hypothetical protein
MKKLGKKKILVIDQHMVFTRMLPVYETGKGAFINVDYHGRKRVYLKGNGHYHKPYWAAHEHGHDYELAWYDMREDALVQ